MDNYTGPNWSDGKFQQSVEFGSSLPLSSLDAASRLHDSAYAKYKDEKHRIAADIIYRETLDGIDGLDARLLAGVPVYGNYTKNRAVDYGSSVYEGFKYGGLAGAFGGLVYTGVANMFKTQDLLENLDTYKSDVKRYYTTDPLMDTHHHYKQPNKTILTTNKNTSPAPLQNKNNENLNILKEVRTPQPKEIELSSVPEKEKNIMAKKIAPTPAPQPSVTVRHDGQTYKPLRIKPRNVTVQDILLYLKYNPKEKERVRTWLSVHPEFTPSPPVTKHKN